jgi:hypothetical protein
MQGGDAKFARITLDTVCRREKNGGPSGTGITGAAHIHEKAAVPVFWPRVTGVDPALQSLTCLLYSRLAKNDRQLSGGNRHSIR